VVVGGGGGLVVLWVLYSRSLLCYVNVLVLTVSFNGHRWMEKMKMALFTQPIIIAELYCPKSPYWWEEKSHKSLGV